MKSHLSLTITLLPPRTQMCEPPPSLPGGSRRPALFQKSSSVDAEIVRRREEEREPRVERR